MTRCILINEDGKFNKIELNIKNKEEIIEIIGKDPKYLGILPNSNIIVLKYILYIK